MLGRIEFFFGSQLTNRWIFSWWEEKASKEKMCGDRNLGTMAEKTTKEKKYERKAPWFISSNS